MTSRVGAGLRLAVATLALAAVWLGVLPRVAAWAPVARHVRRMEEGGVNPAAMVYTELDRLPLRPRWVAEQLALWTVPHLPRTGGGDH